MLFVLTVDMHGISTELVLTISMSYILKVTRIWSTWREQPSPRSLMFCCSNVNLLLS